MKKLLLFDEEERRFYTIVMDFLDTLIAPTLKEIVTEEKYEKLLSLLQDPSIKIRTGRKSPDTTTFGDFAVLLTESEGKESEPLAESLETYFNIFELYFACFGNSTKDSLPQSVRDFLYMPFDAFFHFAEPCNVLPKACREAHAAYDTIGKSVEALFGEVFAEVLKGNKMQLNNLIHLFAYPLAMIQLFPSY